VRRAIDVTELKPSPQAQECFGANPAELLGAVSRAIYQAHGQALDAHVSGGLRSNDTYGATLHVAQYEQLVDMTRDITGVSIRRPVDVSCRFELVVLDEQMVVLYPWRYAVDRATRREDARMRPPVSELRKTLLSLTANMISRQLTFEHAALSAEELDAQFAEEELVLAQLREFGQVVIIGFASSPDGLFDLGWGIAELVDQDRGTVKWSYWEQLPPPEAGSDAFSPAIRSPLAPRDGDRASRFDSAAADDDFGLSPRLPLAEPPISEPEAPPQPTGSSKPED
jgi:hypothetical protein